MVPNPEDMLDIIARVEKEESWSFCRGCVFTAIGMAVFWAVVIWLSWK